MLFRFHIGWRRGGGIGFRQTPIYYMPYWRIARADANRVEYRPSERTLIHLLGMSAMAVIALAATVWFAGFPWSAGEAGSARRAAQRADAQRQALEMQQMADELKRKLPPKRIAELERAQAERKRELGISLARSQRGLSVVRSAGRVFHWIAFVALVAIAVLPLAGFSLQQVVIEKAHAGGLVIRKRGLWPSVRHWPDGALRQIVYGAEEETMRRRYRTITIGWMWMVKLQASPQIAAEQGPSLVDDPEVVFYIDHQKEQPASAQERPESVRRMVKHLCRLTGIRTIGTFEVEVTERGLLFPRRRKTTKTSSTHSAATRQVYSGTDEVPERLLEKLRAPGTEREADGTIVHRSVRLTVRDAEGNERTYSSLDEMPPDVRTHFERAVRPVRREKKRDA